MQSSHAPAAVSAAFDDPTLVAYGGLEPLVRLAERCGPPGLVAERVRLPVTADGVGAFPAAKVMSLVAGMAAGADSIAAARPGRPGHSRSQTSARTSPTPPKPSAFCGTAPA